MNRTTNLKRNAITQRNNSDKYLRMICEEVQEGKSGVYVKLEQLRQTMQNATLPSLEEATEAAKDGIGLLQTFIKLAESEKKE